MFHQTLSIQSAAFALIPLCFFNLLHLVFSVNEFICTKLPKAADTRSGLARRGRCTLHSCKCVQYENELVVFCNLVCLLSNTGKTILLEIHSFIYSYHFEHFKFARFVTQLVRAAHIPICSVVNILFIEVLSTRLRKIKNNCY